MRPRVSSARLALRLFLVVGGLFAVAQSADPGEPKAGPKAGDEITNSIGMKLVYIPPGKFLMGSPEDEPGRFDDETQHEVEVVKGFYLGKYEVTQEEYQKIAEKNPSAFRGPKLPVETVGWKDAKEFCRLLSIKEGKGGKDGKGAGGYRLPTEAEWELACRAGTKTIYHFGNAISLAQANIYNAKKNGTVAVGSYAPNAWGLHDMHGNVWEWCDNFYSPNLVDPVARIKGKTFSYVVRGGGWGNEPNYCRSAARMRQENTISGNIGFRVALNSAE